MIHSDKTYLDQKYNEYFRRPLFDRSPILSSQEIDYTFPDISSSRLSGGIFETKNGVLKIDLENNLINLSDGITELLSIDADKKRVVIKDKNGTTLVDTD